MSVKWMLVALASLSIVSTGRAQDQKPPLPKGQMPDLGRPTKSEDALPPFNFDDYFLGKWTFEWDVPEGPLGESGRITGTTVYSVVEAGKFYRADTDAKGPGGAFTLHEVIAYQKDNKALSRFVTDSRGFSYLQLAAIGGDLGGIYNIHFDSAPFTVNGKSVRLRHEMRLLSPLNYRVSSSISVDGGPFTNLGTPWFRKNP